MLFLKCDDTHNEYMNSVSPPPSDTVNTQAGEVARAKQAEQGAGPTTASPAKSSVAKTPAAAPDTEPPPPPPPYPASLYALRLLEEEHILVVPGSGFKQREHSWHFRTTFLPPEEQIDAVVEKLAAFHARFLEKYK